MLRLGAPPDQTREMDLDDIFLSRVQLMIIMAKAYLDGCPMGEQRRLAMLENARHVEIEAIDLGGLIDGRNFRQSDFENAVYDSLFYRRVKLLAEMVKAAAKGLPISDNRKKAMKENLNIICEAFNFPHRQGDDTTSKVA